MTRREWLAMIAATPLLKAAPDAPSAPVSIAKCASYDEDVQAKLAAMFDQLGGLERLGRNKTLTVKIKVPGNPYMYPAYDLNHSYEDTDVFVSMAKLKNHDTCGVTLSLKNCFGTIPASIYGDTAGVDEPNENPVNGRLAVGHQGKRQPS